MGAGGRGGWCGPVSDKGEKGWRCDRSHKRNERRRAGRAVKKGWLCNHRRARARRRTGFATKGAALTLPRGESSCFCARTDTRATRATRRGARAEDGVERRGVDFVWTAAILCACACVRVCVCVCVLAFANHRELWRVCVRA